MCNFNQIPEVKKEHYSSTRGFQFTVDLLYASPLDKMLALKHTWQTVAEEKLIALTVHAKTSSNNQ